MNNEIGSFKTVSKFLSLVLRHAPEVIGLKMDKSGWVDIDELIHSANLHGKAIDRDIVHQVVATSDKQRFCISADRQRIRANQGHSLDVDLGLIEQEPPETLFHGTAARFLDSIENNGLHPGSRQHVHLSIGVDTARKVGARHGKPVVLAVDAKAMSEDGHAFFVSENGVWLTRSIPFRYLSVVKAKTT